jgi:hypothetical protein
MLRGRSKEKPMTNFIVEYSVIGKRGMKWEKFESEATAEYYANKLYSSNNCPDIWFKDLKANTIARWTKERYESIYPS